MLLLMKEYNRYLTICFWSLYKKDILFSLQVNCLLVYNGVFFVLGVLGTFFSSLCLYLNAYCTNKYAAFTFPYCD